MDNIYIFDMDGTLTPARKPMTENFAKVFLPWLENNCAYIATGSDFEKLEEQMPQGVINAFAGIYCSMGNECWRKGAFEYQNDLVLEPELIEKLENYRQNSQYPHERFPNYIEKRIGMVNFSVLGRDCPYEARLQYAEWDGSFGEREKIQAELAAQYPQYDFLLGGNISIDIVKKECGKGQIGRDLRQKFPHAKLIFFGDKTFPGGNDYELAKCLMEMDNTKVVQVENPDELLKYLEL